MSIQLNRRIAAAEKKLNSANSTTWVRVIDYGDKATKAQSRELAEGLAKAQAGGNNVLRRVFSDAPKRSAEQ